MNKENLYLQVMQRLDRNLPLLSTGTLPQREQAFHFAMNCNGFFQLRNLNWVSQPEAVRPLSERFKNQAVVFFGPNALDTDFSCPILDVDFFNLSSAFHIPTVTDSLIRRQAEDIDQSVRYAFILGSTAQALRKRGPGFIDQTIRFIADMTKLGDHKSLDAIARTMAMYVLSGGNLDVDNQFKGHIYHMSEAVSEDKIIPMTTTQLGLSQAGRFRYFFDRIQGKTPRSFPDLTNELADLYLFPTVGAEFHFPLSAAEKNPAFWQNLALFNLSQDQKDSYVQYSRSDRGVLEVRMNPSVFPVTIANWNYMRRLLPELSKTYFTITLNRPAFLGDFTWGEEDSPLLNQLRALGLLTFGGTFENMPQTDKSDEIDFGDVYLGQTVKVVAGRFIFSGLWGGSEGKTGQMGLYLGFGDNLPDLAYFLSHALAEPSILRFDREHPFNQIGDLWQAMELTPKCRQETFRVIESRIKAEGKLNRASESGNRIVELLNP